MSSPLSIRIDATLKARLENTARAEERSVSYMAQKAIEDFVNAREFKRDVIIQAYQASLTEKEFISGEKMGEWVESWGSENELPEPSPDIFRA